MPTTEIPKQDPASPPLASRPGGDLYDAEEWKSAYLDENDVPALLIQLQDDLSRSRQREAFWMSVVVHLTIIIVREFAAPGEIVFPSCDCGPAAEPGGARQRHDFSPAAARRTEAY